MTEISGPKRYRHPPGFRFAIADAAVLAAGACAAPLLWGRLGELALIFPVVVTHFFMFCNVFRIRRSYELIWAAAFVVNISAGVVIGRFSWPVVMLAQLPVTVA